MEALFKLLRSPVPFSDSNLISSHLIAGSDLESRHSEWSRHRYGRRIAMSFVGDILNSPRDPVDPGHRRVGPEGLIPLRVFPISCLCPSCLSQ